MMDLHSIVLKCAHALLQRTMEGFYSALATGKARITAILRRYYRRALFSGACQIMNASKPNGFLLSERCRAPHVSRVLF